MGPSRSRCGEVARARTSRLLAFAVVFGLIFTGWLVAVTGAGACDENVVAGSSRAHVCAIVGEGYGWPTVGFMLVPAIVLGITGVFVPAARLVLLIAFIALALQVAALIATVIFAI
jgi:hypothetical protein